MRHTLIAAMLLLGSGAAHATTYTATYTGIVGFGFQLTDYFGGGARSLNQLPYTMTYTIDDATPGATLAASATGSGISGAGAHNPVRMSITIDGVTRSIDSSGTGNASVNDAVHASGQAYAGVFDRVDHSASESVVTATFYHVYTADTYIASYAQDFVTSPDFRAPVTYGGTTGTDSIYNLVQFNDYNFATGTQINYAYLNLNIGTYRFAEVVPSTGGVPEPASWALLIAGFGLTGAALRQSARRHPLRAA